MKKLIVVSDWVNDNLSCQEFRSAFEGYLSSENYGNISFVSSTPSTIHTGFLLSQVVETEERLGKPLSTVIFVNTDPRLQAKTSVEKNQGSKFTFAKLKSGIFVCGPNAQYCYSLIKNKIDAFFVYQGFEKGSQFRSRDLYARFCAHLVEEKEDELDLEEISLDEILDLSGYYIGHIDNFGNIKTTIKSSQLKGHYRYGDVIKIKINKIEKKARYVTGLFGGNVGELVIYPGSSGQKDDPYLEISVWRHFTEEKPSTGKDEFHNPLPGMEILILR